MAIPPKLALWILIGVILFVAIGRTISLIISYQQEGQWSTFDSANLGEPSKDPDGFRLSFPTSWSNFFIRVAEPRTSASSEHLLRVHTTGGHQKHI